MGDLLDVLSKTKDVTTSDLTKDYWQIPLETESPEKSAFVTDLGLFWSGRYCPLASLVQEPHSRGDLLRHCLGSGALQH